MDQLEDEPTNEDLKSNPLTDKLTDAELKI